MTLRGLLVVGEFYGQIASLLETGAVSVLESEGVVWERVGVPGALEIPPMIARASGFDAYVALGCVIRGETSHYETVSGESARGLMELGVRRGLAIGNGILTVETEAQALVRADPLKGDKGGAAARAALCLARAF